ncbi:MAG TPA: Crp/Fnr family transcriptional regulator [Terriglobales bacterium]|nr:Crp/Fnr family transcriptional regulator [Terriglobales bacterium]
MVKTDSNGCEQTSGGRRLNGGPVLNLILANAPDREFEIVRPHLEYQELPALRVLNEPGQRVNSIYFPNCGLVSVEVPTSEGASMEVTVVGRGGFVGIPLLCGAKKTLLRAVVQIRGSAYRMKGEAFEQIAQAAPRFYALMKHFALIQGMQVAQIAACNRFHHLEERMARWLLGAADRVGIEIPITQESLAQKLGTGRASLSVAASRIRKLGIIQYARGRIRILDRGHLEELSCECYDTVQRFYGELGLAW